MDEELKYTFDISEDPMTHEYVVDFPALHISHRGPTCEAVTEWVMEFLAEEYGIAIPAEGT